MALFLTAAVIATAALLVAGCEDSLVFPNLTTTLTPVTTTTASSTSTTSSSTITGTISPAVVNSSKGAATFASSGNGLANVAAGSQAPSASSAGAFGVLAFAVPASFFGPPDTDGYVIVSGFSSNQSVEVRYIMQSGNPVNPSYLATKALAVMGDFDWDSMFTGGEPSVAQVAVFMGSPSYESLTNLADYLNWA
ncbi:MAG: hypothetical protein JW782_06510 [Candidatus Saganbacteria bacterium]|nr:hypothetical protein [Candidatus Saganbacteria bacterium]